jgi:hypothetical protein
MFLETIQSPCRRDFIVFQGAFGWAWNSAIYPELMILMAFPFFTVTDML